jgi:hypothetical protein
VFWPSLINSLDSLYFPSTLEALAGLSQCRVIKTRPTISTISGCRWIRIPLVPEPSDQNALQENRKEGWELIEFHSIQSVHYHYFPIILMAQFYFSG